MARPQNCQEFELRRASDGKEAEVILREADKFNGHPKTPGYGCAGENWLLETEVQQRAEQDGSGAAQPRSVVHSGGPTAASDTQLAATCLMRAIISSTARSVVHFSLSTRFIALAHTFSLFSTVNL